MATNKENYEVVQEELPKNQINLNPIKRLFRRFFDPPKRHVEPYVAGGQVVADLGCNTGYYTLALAECVGSEGKVYAVDLKEEYIRAVEKEADERGYRNIEAHAASAHDLSFIKDESVDFVLANGLLCNMPDHRQSAVNEMKRILKPAGKAYLSLGGPPPFGFVDGAEWEKMLERFKVEQRGGFLQKWASVSKKGDGKHVSGDYAETTKRPRFMKLRKKLGE